MSELVALKTVYTIQNINSTNIPSLIGNHFIMNYPSAEIQVFATPRYNLNRQFLRKTLIK